MEIVIALAALAVGILIGKLISHRRPLGDLRIDQSDPDSGPMLFLELGTDVSNVMKEKHVIFRVKVEDFLPRK